ncbi:MAG: hypothetical protein DRI84_10130 [Bacteroidetes bacterium]|nr:MAG: hypothetical protein DRI84_10130 [Bacteroidota bacterium]
MLQQPKKEGTVIDNKYVSYDELKELLFALKEDKEKRRKLLFKIPDEDKDDFLIYRKYTRDEEEKQHKEEEYKKNDLSDPKNIANIWNPVTNLYKNSFYDIQELFGTFIAEEAFKCVSVGKKYTDEFRDFMKEVAYKNISVEEVDDKGMDAFLEYKEKKKADYHFQKKHGDRLDRDINEELSVVLEEDASDRKFKKEMSEREAIAEKEAYINMVSQKHNEYIDKDIAFTTNRKQNIKNTIPIKKEIFNNMDNNIDIFYNPTTLFVFLLKETPYENFNSDNDTYEYWYRKRGLITVRTDKKYYIEKLNIKRQTVARWFNQIEEQDYLFLKEETVKNKNYKVYVLGYIEDNEEKYFYQFNDAETRKTFINKVKGWK